MPKGYYLNTDSTVRDQGLAKQCFGKNRYNKREAIVQAKVAHHKGRVKLPRVYPCGDHWHIATGHSEPLKRKPLK